MEKGWGGMEKHFSMQPAWKNVFSMPPHAFSIAAQTFFSIGGQIFIKIIKLSYYSLSLIYTWNETNNHKKLHSVQWPAFLTAKNSSTVKFKFPVQKWLWFCSLVIISNARLWLAIKSTLETPLSFISRTKSSHY